MNIVDTIQEDAGNGFNDAFDCSANISFSSGTPLVNGQEIQAGTLTILDASVFSYSCDADPLSGGIRNSAKVTILNHSGSLGTPKGPNPKATYVSHANAPATPPACDEAQECGCTLTQGFWKNHLDAWPAGGPQPGDIFYLSGQTYQEVLATPDGGNGYYKLAHQFIAATLNMVNDACTPEGLFGEGGTYQLAAAWLATNTQGTPRVPGPGGGTAPTGCYAPGACGLQITWAGILDEYNNGIYPGGPEHCE